MSKFRTNTKIAGSVLALLLPFIVSSSAQAGSAKFSISPSTATMTQGASTTLTVTAEAGSTAVSALQACVTYDSAKLQLMSTDYSKNPLAKTTGFAPTTDCPAGELQLGRYDTTPTTGTFTVASLTFKALLASTTATVGFDDAKSSIGGDTPSGSSGATLTLNPIPAAPASNAPRSPLTDTTATADTEPGGAPANSSSNRLVQIILAIALLATIAVIYALKKNVSFPGNPFSKK